jgi:hypothetical protein
MLKDYLNEIAKRRAKKMAEQKAKDAQPKETWKLAPEDFEQPMGVYAFMTKKKDDEDEDDYE